MKGVSLLSSIPLLIIGVSLSSGQLLAPLMSLAGGIASNLNPFHELASSLTGSGGGLLSSLRGSASSLRGSLTRPSPVIYSSLSSPAYYPSSYGTSYSSSYAAPSTTHYGYHHQASNPSAPMLSPAELAQVMHAQAQNEAAHRNQHHQNHQAKLHHPQPQPPVQAQAQNHPQAQPSPSPPPAVRKPHSPPSPDDEEYEDEGYDEGPENHNPPMRGNFRSPEDERDSYANENDEEARDYGARRPLRHRRPHSDSGYVYRRPSNHIRNSPRDHRYEEDRYRDPDPGVPVSAAGGFDPPPRHHESRYNDRLPLPHPSSYSYNPLHHQRPRGYDRPDEIEDERDHGRSPSEARDTRSHPSTYGYYNSEEFVRNEPPPPPPPHRWRPVDDEDYERSQRLRGPPPSNYHPVNDYHRERPHHHPDGPYH